MTDVKVRKMVTGNCEWMEYSWEDDGSVHSVIVWPEDIEEDGYASCVHYSVGAVGSSGKSAIGTHYRGKFARLVHMALLDDLARQEENANDS